MPGKTVIVEAVAVEVVGHTESADDVVRDVGTATPPAPAAIVKMFADAATHATPVFTYATR